MTSEVAWAVLGLIIERPGYGGQLRRRLELSDDDSFSLQSVGHVYRILDRLMERGLIERVLSEEGHAVASGTDRLPMVPYVATAKGRQAFNEHVLIQMSENRRRAKSLIRQFSVLAGADPKLGLEALESYSSICAQQARQAGRTPSDARIGLGGALAAMLIREDERLAGESTVRWIDYAREVVAASRDGVS